MSGAKETENPLCRTHNSIEGKESDTGDYKQTFKNIKCLVQKYQSF